MVMETWVEVLIQWIPWHWSKDEDRSGVVVMVAMDGTTQLK